MNSEDKLVSVIMGVYNCKDDNIVIQCINSIIAQTHLNWEFIICDDGSEEFVYQAIKRWENIDNRIKVIRNEANMTLAPTLNRCIRHAKGEYIARMDIDDCATPQRLERQLDFLTKHPEVDFCGSYANLYDEEGIWGLRKVPKYPQNKDFLSTVPFVHPTIMAHRSFYEKYSYSESALYYKCEDYELFARALSEGAIGKNIEEPLLNYFERRETGKEMTFRHRIKAIKVRYIIFKRLKLYPMAIIYVLKPIILLFVPRGVIRKMKKEEIV